MKKLIFVLVLAIITTSTYSSTDKKASPDNKKALQQLSGTYRDPKPVDWGRGTFGTRTFTFNKGKWTLEFVLALDPQMQRPVFVFRTMGTYSVLDKSTAVNNAYNALFIENKKYLTLKTADPKLAAAFGLADCNLTKDIEKDISLSGCALWKSVKACNQDHDLLSLDEVGNLYFGVRPPDNDMCTADKRPTQLTPAVVKITR